MQKVQMYIFQKHIIQDNTGTVLLQFGVVILVGLALSKFFNTKTARGAMKDNKAAK